MTIATPAQSAILLDAARGLREFVDMLAVYHTGTETLVEICGRIGNGEEIEGVVDALGPMMEQIKPVIASFDFSRGEAACRAVENALALVFEGKS